MAAAYFGVPGKDWRSAMRAKNKSLMRRRLAETGIEQVAAVEIRPSRSTIQRRTSSHRPGLPSGSQAVRGGSQRGRHARPRSGGAGGADAHEIFARRPGETLLAEQYLPGGLRTLETLGDGVTTWVLGGFQTSLSPLPFFIEERLTWDASVPETRPRHVLGALAELGVTFGACHTEYVLDAEWRRGLIEVNDRHDRRPL